MNKKVIQIVTGNGATFKFETRSEDLANIKKEAEGLLQPDEIIKSIQWVIHDTI